MNEQPVCLTLDNKLDVFIIKKEIHHNSMEVGFAIQVGDIHSPEIDVARLTLKTIIFNGSNKYDPESSLGLYANNPAWRVGRTATYITYHIDREKLGPSLDRLADMMTNPLLPDVNMEEDATKYSIDYDADMDYMFDDMLIDNGKRSKDINKSVRNFFNEYYSADIMKLVVTTDDVDKAVEIITKKMSKIPNKNVSRRVMDLKNAFNAGEYIKATMGRSYFHFMKIEWKVPYIDPTKNPLPFISWLIFQGVRGVNVYGESPGLLKTNVLYNVLDSLLSTGTLSLHYSTSLTNLLITVQYNDMAEAEYEESRNIIYNYFKYLKTIDIKDLYEKYLEEYNTHNTNLRICERVLKVISETEVPLNLGLVAAEYKISDHREMKRNMDLVLDSITPQNAIVLETYSREEFNPTHPYPVEVQRSRKVLGFRDRVYHFILPTPNRYIEASNTKFVTDVDMKKPQTMVKSESMECYWMTTRNQQNREASICTGLRYNIQSREELTYLYFYYYAINFLLRYERKGLREDEDPLILPNTALSDIKVYMNNDVLKVNVFTNIGKMTVAVFQVSTIISPRYFIDNFTQQDYNKVWKEILTTRRNNQRGVLDATIEEASEALMCKYEYTTLEFLKDVKNITFEKCRKNITRILERGHKTSVFISGNIYEDLAKGMAKSMQKILDGGKRVPASSYTHHNNYENMLRGKSLVFKVEKNIRTIILKPERDQRMINLIIEPIKWKYSNDDMWIKELCLYSALKEILAKVYQTPLLNKGYPFYAYNDRIVCNNHTKSYITFEVEDIGNNVEACIALMEKAFRLARAKLSALTDAEIKDMLRSVWHDFYTDESITGLRTSSGIILQDVILSGYGKFNFIDRVLEIFSRITKENLLEFYDKIVERRRTYLLL